ncbi:MAG: hypothetical protein HY040_06895 [Planctomycetes bacterium]|nr:hypothetical protein [Planctomycetota bacterium]
MIAPWQATKVRASLQPNLNYLNRLRARMDRAGLHQEELFKLVCDAQEALRLLYVELHYLACDGGVYRERKESKPV